ncbi:hypothetical protein LP420_29875 [Massilia sp. B-10]|nr:hypothetical protein LP420_29875 [Massilia sp. B-10]UUZ53080.1 hypothetical protein LP419_29440 [Massilia sp. H-1]
MCGHTKRRFGAQCERCHFQPATDTELAKSMMLSLNFEVQSPQYGNDDLSKSWNELMVIMKQGEEIQGYSFDAELLAKAQHEIVSANLITRGQILTTTVFWLAPTLLLIAGVVCFAIWG